MDRFLEYGYAVFLRAIRMFLVLLLPFVVLYVSAMFGGYSPVWRDLSVPRLAWTVSVTGVLLWDAGRWLLGYRVERKAAVLTPDQYILLMMRLWAEPPADKERQ